MAEFKITEGIDGEIMAMKHGGMFLAQESSEATADGLSLEVASRFCEQHEQILKLLLLYRSLVMKDAADLTEMVLSARKTDESIAVNT